MSFSAEKQKAKKKKKKKSDLTDRTGHWIENQSVKYLKRSFVFKQSETDKEKVHTLVCIDACVQNVYFRTLLTCLSVYMYH